MASYAFRAVDLAGVPSRGEVDAASKAHVSEQLRQRGLIVLDVSEKHESMKLESVFQRFKNVKMRAAGDLLAPVRDADRFRDADAPRPSTRWRTRPTTRC